MSFEPTGYTKPHSDPLTHCIDSGKMRANEKQRILMLIKDASITPIDGGYAIKVTIPYYIYNPDLRKSLSDSLGLDQEAVIVKHLDKQKTITLKNDSEEALKEALKVAKEKANQHAEQSLPSGRSR